MVWVPVGAVGVTVTWQVAVPKTVCASVQALMLSVLEGTLTELTATLPVGVEAGPLSVSVAVMVKFAPWPIAAVAVSGAIVVEVVRVFTVTGAVLVVAPAPLSVAVLAPVVLSFMPVL